MNHELVSEMSDEGLHRFRRLMWSGPVVAWRAGIDRDILNVLATRAHDRGERPLAERILEHEREPRDIHEELRDCEPTVILARKTRETELMVQLDQLGYKLPDYILHDDLRRSFWPKHP